MVEKTYCKHCGAENAKKNYFCSNCDKRIRRNYWKIIVITGILIPVSIFVAAFIYTALSKRPQSETYIAPTPRLIKASASVSYDRLYLTNTDDFTWRSCTLVVNSDYKLNVDEIKMGAEESFNLSSFAKSDGTRFNNSDYKLISLQITCTDTPVGNPSQS